MTAEVVEEGQDFARIRMSFLSDFVHADGRVLQRDLVHFSAEFLLTATAQTVEGNGLDLPDIDVGWRLPDPYLHPAGPLLMDGAFRSLHDMKLGQRHSTAVLPRSARGCTCVRSGRADTLCLARRPLALWPVRREEDGMSLLCVPLRCERLDILPGVNHRTLAGQECRLTCSAPCLEGENILVDWAEAADASGRIPLP